MIKSQSIPAPYRDWNSLWISVSCGFYWFAFSMLRPMMSVYVMSKGILGVQLGFVLSVYALLPLLIAMPSGFIADRIGRTNVLRAGVLIMAVSGVVYMTSSGLWGLLLGQMLAGVGQMAVWLAVQVLITGGAKEGSEGRYATFSLFMALGQLFAPIVAGFLHDRYGYTAVFMGYLFINLLLIASAWQCRDEENENKPTSEVQTKRGISSAGSVFTGFRGMLKQSVRLIRNRMFSVILLTTFIALFITDVRTAYLPVYLVDLHISQTQIGLLVSSGALSAVFVRPIYPVLMRTLGFRRLLILTYVVSLLLLFVTPLLENFYVLIVLLLITGFALGVNQPLTLSMIAQYTESGERGLGIGLRLMANRASQLLDPLFFGVFTALIGIRSAFVFVGIILAFFCVGTIWLYMSAEKERHNQGASVE